MVKRLAELPFSLPSVLLLGALDLDPLGGVVHRKAAEFIGLSTDQRGSSASVVGIAVRVDRAHAELSTAGVLGPELAYQQRHALALVSLPGLLLLGMYYLDRAFGVADTGVCLGS
ncbi:hypothetical protein [Microbacterium aurum]